MRVVTHEASPPRLGVAPVNALARSLVCPSFATARKHERATPALLRIKLNAA
jgi:hypothetical protein